MHRLALETHISKAKIIIVIIHFAALPIEFVLVKILVILFSVDTNECASSNDCPDKSKCSNTEGSYTCKCLTGYTGTNCDGQKKYCDS